MDWRALREGRGMTQAHLAEAAGVNPKTIARLERGDSVSSETLMSVRAVFDLPAQVLGQPSSSAEQPAAPLESGRERPRTPWLVRAAAKAAYFLLCLHVGFVLVAQVATRTPAIHESVLSPGILPPDRSAIMETLALSGQEIFLARSRDVLVRAERFSRLPEMPDRVAWEPSPRTFSPVPAFDWPETMTAGMRTTQRQVARTTGPYGIGMYSDNEISQPTPPNMANVPWSQAEGRRTERALDMFASHAIYDTSLFWTSRPVPRVVVAFSPVNARACGDALRANSALAPGRVLVSVAPVMRGQMATGMDLSDPVPGVDPREAVCAAGGLMSMRWTFFPDPASLREFEAALSGRLAGEDGR